MSVEAARRHATQRNGWVWCALAAVLFGAATPATKLLVDKVGAVALAGLLYLGAAAAVAPFALREQRSKGSSRRVEKCVDFEGARGGQTPPGLDDASTDRNKRRHTDLRLGFDRM